MEEQAWALLHKLDAMGGSVAAIETGYMQDEIARSAYEYQRKIETGEKIIVGVNKFGVADEGAIPIFKVDDSIREQQVQKLSSLKAERNQPSVENALKMIRSAATEERNIMPAVVNAVEQWCTLGEISDVLRSVYGEYR